MPVRATMQYIIDFVHTLIDVPGEEPLADQEIQDLLDLNRKDFYQKPLKAAETLSLTGDNERHDFWASFSFWEEDAVIQDRRAGTVVTADEDNYLLGMWHFDDDQPLELVVTGKVYNVYWVASKCALRLVQTMRGDFNFTADGLTVQRIAQIRDLTSLAKDLSTQGWAGGIQTIKMVRKDLRGGSACG